MTRAKKLSGRPHRKRKPTLYAKVALKAVNGDKTLAEIA